MATTLLRTGLILGLLFCPLSAWLSPRVAAALRARQYIRPEGPVTHGKKAGTPTMGGLVPLSFLLAGTAAIWAQAGLDWPSVFSLLALILGGAVGLVDDMRGQKRRSSTGFFPHQTILAQFLAALVLVFWATKCPQKLRLPFSRFEVILPLWAWLPLLLLGFLGTVNGVNLADGMDGLAVGLFLLALVGLGPLCFSSPTLGAMSLMAAGAGLGFLWANAYPARVFLGNVGSMGLGGFLFGLAWSSGGILFLPLAGGVFVLEALSVLGQVASYKLTGVRLLKMSPLHHHLEDSPVPWPHRLRSPRWPEPKVVTRLWVLGALFALLSILASL